MCIGKAMIIRKGMSEPDYLLDSNDHAPLVEKLNLKDVKLENRDFVRIELCPKNSLTSTNPDDWEFRIDEIGTLPAWFRKFRHRENMQAAINDWENKCVTVLVKKIIPHWLKKGVGGSLYLEGTQIKTLPKNLKVKGNVYGV